MKRVFTPLVTLVMCSAPLCAEPTSADELLHKVAAAYSRMVAYVIDVRETRTGRALVAGRGDIAEFPHVPVNRIVVARSGSKFHYDVSSDAGHLTWITDGHTTWQYRSELNE